jgi:hypothetical protein
MWQERVCNRQASSSINSITCSLLMGPNCIQRLRRLNVPTVSRGHLKQNTIAKGKHAYCSRKGNSRTIMRL